ncbi:MAG: family 20 glycosylhydrolase [Streptosporangiaceae bacterium]
MDIARVFPRPKSVHPTPGEFRPGTETAVHVSADAPECGQRVAELTGLPLRLDVAPWRVVIGTDAGCRTAPPEEGYDGYAVSVDSDRVELVAGGRRGLAYAVTTYEQLGPGCGRLVDFADLAVRGMHLDLKGPMMRTEFLHRLIERLGRLRVNTLLVEYEDKFPYRAVPGVPVAEALGEDELRSLLAAAAGWGIEVIPLVQCLGHMEYALRSPAGAALAEDGRMQQLCPSHPDALRPFAAMLDEVVDAHPGATAVHIGGDEPWSLGRCPRCRDYADREGLPALYLRHVAPAARLVADRGLRPILWDDVLYGEKCPELVDELPEQTAIMCWEYHVYADRTAQVRWGHAPYVVPRSSRNQPELLPELSPGKDLVSLEDLPESEQRLLRTVKHGGGSDFPGGLSGGPLGEPFPWAAAIRARGRTVFGASAARGADGPNAAFPTWSRRIANTAAWARQARPRAARRDQHRMERLQRLPPPDRATHHGRPHARRLRRAVLEHRRGPGGGRPAHGSCGGGHAVDRDRGEAAGPYAPRDRAATAGGDRRRADAGARRTVRTPRRRHRAAPRRRRLARVLRLRRGPGQTSRPCGPGAGRRAGDRVMANLARRRHEAPPGRVHRAGRRRGRRGEDPRTHHRAEPLARPPERLTRLRSASENRCPPVGQSKSGP